MKNTDKAELVRAARLASDTLNMDNDEWTSFWEELGDRVASRDKTRKELVKPRAERD